MPVNYAADLAALESEIKVSAQYWLYERSIFLQAITAVNTAGIPGLTASFPNIGSVSASDVAENESAPESALSTTMPELKVSEKEVNVPVSDLALAAVGKASLISDIGKLLGSAMARKFDADVAASFSGFSKSIGSSGVALDAGSVAKGVTLLMAQEFASDIYGAVHPFQALGIKEGLTNLYGDGTKTPPSDILANQVMIRYYIGSVSGANIIETASISADTNDDATGAVFAPSGIGAHIKKLFDLEYDRDGKGRVTHVLGHGMWKTGVINPLHGVRLFGACAEPA